MSEISLRGWAAVFKADERITDQAILRDLDGIHYSEEFATCRQTSSLFSLGTPPDSGQTGWARISPVAAWTPAATA